MQSFRMQSSVWRHWGEKMRLEDVEADNGIVGLITSRLWDVAEKSLEEEFNFRIAPVAAEFHVDMDEVLERWISVAVVERIIVVEDYPAQSESSPESLSSIYAEDGLRSSFADSHADDSTSSLRGTLSRLVIATGLISSPRRRAQSALLLLQIPATTDCILQRSLLKQQDRTSPQDFESSNDSAHEAPINRSNPSLNTLSSLSSAEKLIALAEDSSLLSQIDNATRDAIVEAVRTHNLRLLAARYNVVNLDIRNPRQVRAVVGFIAAQIRETNPNNETKEAIAIAPDSTGASERYASGLANASISMKSNTAAKALSHAVHFASSWGAMSVDLASVYRC